MNQITDFCHSGAAVVSNLTKLAVYCGKMAR